MAAKKRTQKRTPKKVPAPEAAPDWGPAFLAALSASGNVRDACRQAGVGKTTVYERREAEPAFAAAMKAAVEDAVEDLELEARRRALQGTERPVFHQGEECGRVREFSDTLMIFLLKAHKPDVYRERHEVKHTGQVRVTVAAEELSDDELAAVVRGRPG